MENENQSQRQQLKFTIVLDELGDVDFEGDVNVLQAVYAMEALKTKLITSQLMQAQVVKQQRAATGIVPARANLQINPRELRGK